MPKAEISDAYGLSVKLEAGEATIFYTVLGDAAAVAITDKRPVGPAGGVQAERRGTPTMGFGTHWAQPDRWLGKAENDG